MLSGTQKASENSSLTKNGSVIKESALKAVCQQLKSSLLLLYCLLLDDFSVTKKSVVIKRILFQK